MAPLTYRKSLVLLFALGVLASCSSGSESKSDGGCPAGQETCACLAGGSCSGGLTCAADLGNICVHLAGSSGGTTGASTGGAGGLTAGTGGKTGTGTGGTAPATGGTTGAGTGGKTGAGGTTGSGGSGTGGAKGGSTGTGGATTGSGGTTGGTGGTTATSCGTIGPAVNGSGEFTHYNFGQGTAHGELGDYQTACGYLGTEGGNSIDTVMNIANTSPAKNTYFAAIPGDGSFSSDKYCGGCVQISNGGNTVVATIIDECPESSNPICQQNPNGELDLSVDAFNALNFPNGNPQGTSWKFVPCPITGNVIVRVKQVNELYIENVILPIQSVSGPGGNASRTTYGTWHFNSNINSGAQLTLTDSAGRTLSVTVSSTNADQNQDTGKQFPKCQ